MLFFVRYIERIVERAIICAALRPVEPTRGCYGSTSVWPGTLQIFFGLRERCTCCLCRTSKALFLFFIEISLWNEQLFAQPTSARGHRRLLPRLPGCIAKDYRFSGAAPSMQIVFFFRPDSRSDLARGRRRLRGDC